MPGALVILHAKRMRRIILSSVACPLLPYFSTLSHKRQDFGKKIKEHKMCLICSTTFVCNVYHSKNNWARYYQKCAYVLTESTCHACQIFIKLEFSGQIVENSKISNYTPSKITVQFNSLMSERSSKCSIVVLYNNYNYNNNYYYY